MTAILRQMEDYHYAHLIKTFGKMRTDVVVSVMSIVMSILPQGQWWKWRVTFVSTFIIEFCMGLLWLLTEATSVSTWKFLTRTDLENSLDLSLEKSHLFWSQHPFPCSWVTSHHGPS